MPPQELRDAKIELNAVQKELNGLPNNRQYEKAYELQGRKRELEERVTELEEGWQETKKDAKQTVDEDEVASIIFSMTGIPVARLVEAETQKLFRMEEELHKRIIGQHEAIVAISKAVRRSRSGLRDVKRPIGSFIFLGPTGVGKTELARALAAYLFEKEDNLIRIDMSEYMESFAVSRLVGAPPGYVGYDEGGQLSEAVRRNPYSVVLLDEIEKAHPEVYNILLQIMEDGRLTDSHGRVIDFKNVILIMTSNIGARSIQGEREMGFGRAAAGPKSSEEVSRQMDSIKGRITDELKRVFRPEFLNRVDETIIFHPLSAEEINEVVTLMLDRVSKQVAQKGMDFEVTEAAKAYLAREGFDPQYGARPLRRAVQRLVEDPLAEEILLGRFLANDTVVVDVDEERGIVFRKGSPLGVEGEHNPSLTMPVEVAIEQPSNSPSAGHQRLTSGNENREGPEHHAPGLLAVKEEAGKTRWLPISSSASWLHRLGAGRLLQCLHLSSEVVNLLLQAVQFRVDARQGRRCTRRPADVLWLGRRCRRPRPRRSLGLSHAARQR